MSAAKIKELRAELQRLERIADDANDARAEQERLLHAALCAQRGIAVGDVIRDQRTGKRGVVCSIDVHDYLCGPAFWVRARMEKADGSFGNSIRHVFNHWEKV